MTYVNVSPAPQTWPIIEAQGFRRYCDGEFLCLPWLGFWSQQGRAVPFDRRVDYGGALSERERETLCRHQDYGCIALLARGGDRLCPFVFQRRRAFFGRIPAAQLVYCRDIADFETFGFALGLALAARFCLIAALDANGPSKRLFGVYRRGRGPKYFKGPERPRLGDLAYCEAVLFGP